MAFMSDLTAYFYPWNHPTAHWLRSNGEVLLCLRCGAKTEPPALDDDPEPMLNAFVAHHAKCPEGLGVRTSKHTDPLFA